MKISAAGYSMGDNGVITRWIVEDDSGHDVGRVATEELDKNRIKVYNLFISYGNRGRGYADFTVKELIRLYAGKELVLVSEADHLYEKNGFIHDGKFMVHKAGEKL